MSNLRDALLLLDDEAEERLLRFADVLTGADNTALWVGAGMSVGSGIPSWSTLLQDVTARFLVNTPADISSLRYPDVFSRCRDAATSESQFWQFISARVCGGAPRTVHENLSKLPFELFVTTNYDCLLEPAHSSLGSAATLVDGGCD